MCQWICLRRASANLPMLWRERTIRLRYDRCEAFLLSISKQLSIPNTELCESGFQCFQWKQSSYQQQYAGNVKHVHSGRHRQRSDIWPRLWTKAEGSLCQSYARNCWSFRWNSRIHAARIRLCHCFLLRYVKWNDREHSVMERTYLFLFRTITVVLPDYRALNHVNSK
ncbi:hypothetical protein RvY_01347-2 [Ramazzottius varieornatus]|uniref:Uncharacterized protein n=1 Tax=Ramazzottius varieornatus TaxID=947166 RepID=A0A1D1UJZ3_RAMVA|nr:hypothetical protein RvY_01347-2 [Ramazzottius varieornatus]